ncbi:unnamed protein product, partial [Rotaria socialis]
LINATTVSYATTLRDGNPQQNAGSTEGGTLLWIYGTGFAENHFSMLSSTETSNAVQLTQGNDVYECRMHIEKVTNTQLTCYTPPLPRDQYLVRVIVKRHFNPSISVQ